MSDMTEHSAYFCLRAVLRDQGLERTAEMLGMAENGEVCARCDSRPTSESERAAQLTVVQGFRRGWKAVLERE